LSSWYPNKKDPLDGNFVQNHARAVATLLPVTALFATSLKNLAATYSVESTVQNQLTEIRVYFQWHPWKFIRFIRTLNAYFLGLKKVAPYDIIHANIFFNAGILAVILGTWKQKPVVLSEHSSWFNTIERMPFFKGLIFNFFQKQISYFMPVSQNLGNKLAFLGVEANKIIPVSNVVDTNIFCFNFHPINKKKIFLHVSNFKEHHKNINGILQTITRLDKSGFDFIFRFVGDGDLKTLIKKSEVLNISHSKLEFYSTTTGRDLASFYQEADSFVLFSRYETQGLVLLESLCCGTPIIATRVGGIAEIIDKNGFLIESEDEIALFEAMRSFIDNKQTFSKQEIASNAQKLYNIQAIGSKLMAIYQKTT
jgi:glycosyltransferase involved in cell wall biosynthesis